MRHHAYLITGDSDEGIAVATEEARRILGEDALGNPDVVILRYGLLSVEEAQMVEEAVMRAPVKGDKKVIIVSATRFFWQAQNALLKTCEEPPVGTYLFLIVPTEGIILPTLRSRLIVLHGKRGSNDRLARDFMTASVTEREKIITKLLERAKTDKEEEKAAARAEAATFLAGLVCVAYEAYRKNPSQGLISLLNDLDRFTPLLHDTSAPLKQIFEHILIVTPQRV